jgi:S1-C subfamily serine protease
MLLCMMANQLFNGAAQMNGVPVNSPLWRKEMALLPPFFLDAVVALGFGDDPEKRNWVGTGFLYGVLEKKSDEKNKSYFVFLVTNKHVINGHDKAWVKFNALSGSGSQDFDVSLLARNGRELWIRHPDDDVDLGAIFVNAKFLRSQNMRFSYFREDDHAYTIAELKSEGVTEGDGVYVLGYPMGLVDTKWQSVICRLGCIARIQDVINSGTGDFLIDASVFPGNSGGPVVLQPESTAITGTKSVSKANLIGVVKSYLPYQDVAVSMQTRRPRITFDENSGLSPVIPVDRLNELMDASIRRLKNRSAQARWKAKQQKNLTPTTASS